MSKQSVEFKSENPLGNCPGIVQGNPKATHHGLIVLQEWWGMNQQIIDEAKELGDLGNFLTLTPDLYRGKVARDNEDAGHCMDDLDWAGAVCDIQGAARYLKTLGCSSVGVTGFCMGGALSLLVGVLVPEISASSQFYGIPKPQYPKRYLADLSKISIPLQCHYGKHDPLKGFSSKEDYDELREILVAGGVNFEFHEYDAVHAFTNKNHRDRYNEEATNLAFDRLVKFMHKHLK